MAEAPNVMVVHPSMPVNNVREMIALARAQPGQIAFASGGVGASTHLAAAMFSAMAKIKMIHVPYKGASGATRELIGGSVADFEKFFHAEMKKWAEVIRQVGIQPL